MANTLKQNREKYNITQEKLANILGVSRRTIVSIEKGSTLPSLDLAYKFSEIFKLPIEQIFINDKVAKKPLVEDIRYADLFCGIGGFRYAAINTFAKYGISSECVMSSDIDRYAQESYAANFGEKPLGDITQINESDVPNHDLLFAGFPCQPFSIIGLGKGFDDTRGTLFFEIARIINAKKPRAFVLENVKRLARHEGGRTLKIILNTLREQGYFVEYKVLNALDCGLPQKRERIVIVGSLIPFNMNWPKKVENGKTLNDILERKVDKKHYASEKILEKRRLAHASEIKPSIWHENKSGNIASYPYSCALRANASYNYLLVNGERRLTPREMLRLQGFPDEFQMVVPDSQIRKQAGNAVPVDMIQAVLDNFIPLVFRKDF